jgi:O-antigen/teichoic acid export membrane protein
MFILTNNIKAEGYGVFTMLVLAMTLIMLVVDLVAGSPLIYFTSRKNTKSLIVTSWIWTFLSIAFFIFVGYFLLLFPSFRTLIIPDGYDWYIIIFAFLNAICYINFNILMGKEMIKEFNISFMVHIVTVVLMLCFFVFGMDIISVHAYLYAVYIAYLFAFVLSGFYLWPHLGKYEGIHIRSDIKDLIRYGAFGQMANTIQMTNKRLSFYIIRDIFGFSSVGVYNSGTQLTEGLRLIGTSISMVQFSRISNTDDKEYAKKLSLTLLKLTILITASALLVMVLIPSTVFTWALGEDFEFVKPVIVSLSPGVLALSASMIFSHYFSGTGRPKYNTWASAIGAVFTLSLVFVLIPAYGYMGAGIATSIAYTSSCIYQFFIFRKLSGASMSEFMISKEDSLLFKEIMLIIYKKIRKTDKN